MTIHLRPAAALLVAGLALLCGAFAGSASAAVPGLQLVSSASLADSLSTKQAVVTCPVGKRLIGAGGEVTFGVGQVVIDDLSPNAGLTNVRIVAREDEDGTTATWFVRGYAICANPVPGLQLVTAGQASNSVSGTGVTATCPVGKKLIGAGGQLTNALGQVVMDDITPNAGLTSVSVTGFEDDTGTTTNWTIHAFAICANPLPGLQRISATGISNSVTGTGATAACTGGRKLIGTGGDFTSGLGQVAMDDIEPDPTLTSLSVIGYEDDNGTAANWSTRAYAICATP